MAMTLLLLLTLFFIVLYGQILQLSHCVKSVRIRSYSGLHFPALRLKYGYLSIFSPNVEKYGPI